MCVSNDFWPAAMCVPVIQWMWIFVLNVCIKGRSILFQLYRRQWMSSLSFLSVCLLSLEEPQRKLLILSTQESVFMPSKRRSKAGHGWFDEVSRRTSSATTNRKSHHTKGREENAQRKTKRSLQAHVKQWQVDDGAFNRSQQGWNSLCCTKWLLQVKVAIFQKEAWWVGGVGEVLSLQSTTAKVVCKSQMAPLLPTGPCDWEEAFDVIQYFFFFFCPSSKGTIMEQAMLITPKEFEACTNSPSPIHSALSASPLPPAVSPSFALHHRAASLLSKSVAQITSSWNLE